jgi:FHA domain
MSISKLALSFRIFQHGQLVREDTLTQGVIKIGKVPSAHLRIDDESVSRMHAILEVTGTEVSLIDLGSTRGTFVNGKKINKATLQSGDSITLGDTRVELTIGEARAVVPPAIPEAARKLAVAAPSAPIAVPVTAPIATVVVAPELTPPVRAARPAAVPREAVDGATAPLFGGAAGRGGPTSEDHGRVRAVEVAAMLGDTVIGVKHCMDPRSGKVTLATWAVMAGSAACLLASAIAFTTSVHTAAVNKTAFEQWTRVDHKPAYAFRPARLGLSVDWAAFGGLALGLVGLTLGVLRIRREKSDPYYRIGTAPGVQLAIEHAPSAAFPLVAPSGDDFVFNYGAGIDGELTVDGVSTSLAELARTGRSRPSTSTAGAIELPIPANGRIRARAGQTTFLVSGVARPRRYASPLLASFERRSMSYVAGSLALHLGVWAFLQTLPPDATGINTDLPTGEDPRFHIVGAVAIDPAPPKPVRADDGGDVGDRVEASMAMPGPSGESGNPNGEQPAKLKVEHVANVEPQRSKDELIRDAAISGVLGSSLLMTSVKALAATGDVASGFDLESMNGGLYGGDGLGRGQFGNGLRGLSYGGGCGLATCGTIPGDGQYDKHLIGTRKGSTYGLPNANHFGMPGHTPNLPHVYEPVVSGSDYSKSIIRRYIMRYREQLGYCYEKQLLVHPTMAGQVTAAFFIGPAGVVQSSSANGLDTEVSSCIATVIGTIAFPPPRDGGGVQVNYPFTFRPTTG